MNTFLNLFFYWYQRLYGDAAWVYTGLTNPLHWYSVVPSRYVLGFIGGLFLIYYFVFELAYGFWSSELRKTLPVRILLLSHIGIYYLYLVLCVGVRKEHYLGPVLPNVLLLSFFAIFQTIQMIKWRIARPFFYGLLAVLLWAGLAERGTVLMPRLKMLAQKEKDPCVKWAEWLNSRYSEKTTYLADCRSITYMMKMDLQAGAYQYDAEELKKIMQAKGDPDFIVLILKKNLKLVDELKDKYELVLSDEYYGNHTDEVEMIRVLERKNQKKVDRK